MKENIKEIQDRLDRGYTMAIYGNSANIHEQMTNDIEKLLEALTLGGVVVSDADIYLASVDKEVDLLDARGFRQGAKWCRRQY